MLLSTDRLQPCGPNTSTVGQGPRGSGLPDAGTAATVLAVQPLEPARVGAIAMVYTSRIRSTTPEMDRVVVADSSARARSSARRFGFVSRAESPPRIASSF